MVKKNYLWIKNFLLSDNVRLIASDSADPLNIVHNRWNSPERVCFGAFWQIWRNNGISHIKVYMIYCFSQSNYTISFRYFYSQPVNPRGCSLLVEVNFVSIHMWCNMRDNHLPVKQDLSMKNSTFSKRKLYFKNTKGFIIWIRFDYGHTCDMNWYKEAIGQTNYKL